MKNTRDISILKLIIVLVAYYLISVYLPNLLNFKSSTVNNVIKDLIITLVLCIIYYKDIKKGFGQFKHNKKLAVLLWAFLIYVSILGINIVVSKWFPSLADAYDNDKNRMLVNNLLNAHKYYGIVKLLFFTPIIESILLSLSIRNVIKGDILFIVVASLVYTYFNYTFVGLDTLNLLGALFICFIPRCLYNFAFVKNKNNVVFLMILVFILYLVPMTLNLLG